MVGSVFLPDDLQVFYSSFMEYCFASKPDRNTQVSTIVKVWWRGRGTSILPSQMASPLTYY